MSCQRQQLFAWLPCFDKTLILWLPIVIKAQFYFEFQIEYEKRHERNNKFWRQKCNYDKNEFCFVYTKTFTRSS